MNAFWSYFWPPLAAGLVIGILFGLIGFRHGTNRRGIALGAGALAAIASAALWHGPFGGGDRFATSVERTVRETTAYWQIPEVTGQIHHGPLTREIILFGPADDFQRSELVHIIEGLPGVARASWSPGSKWPPLILEGAASALAGFLLGLLLAYLIELRRRYNAQWKW